MPNLCPPTFLRTFPLALLLGVAVALFPGGEALAANLPTGFAEQRVTEDLDNPTAMQFAPDGRLFVCQQGGALRVVKNGVLLSAPFVELEVDSDGERGLLGVAFHPEFATNGFVYVYHTVPGARPHNRVTRFTANGDGAVEGSGTVILDLETLSTATNHNGGAIHFGTDGMLYVAVGDNADGANSQTLTNRLGKLLRLRPDGGIPADNPFFNTAAGVNRAIWALGLRNPYTFDVERGTGRIFINDVGQNTWEEVNLGVAGANYGWPVVEGPSNDARFRAPLLAYRHGSGTSRGNAITGGAFYRPITPQFPDEYLGDFFFADFTNGWIRRRDSATGAISLFATGIDAPVDLKVGPDGALYYLSRGESAVYRVGYSAGGTLEALRLQPAQVRGGRKVRGTLVFSSPTTRAVTVRLTSSDRKRAKMRTQIRVGKGRRTFSFPISTRRVKKEKAILIRARLGAVTREATLTLSP